MKDGNRYFVTLIIVAILTIGATVQSCAILSKSSERETSQISDFSLPEFVIPDGFGVQLVELGDLDLIANAGFKFIRNDLCWEGVERQPGIYDFGSIVYGVNDALVEGCSKRGIRMICILDYSNPLYESNRSIHTENGRKAFANFAEAAARRYAGKGILWEIWNEPNQPDFWTPSQTSRITASLSMKQRLALRKPTQQAT